MLKLVEIEIASRTDLGELRYHTRFTNGLNVLSAPNSFGKSTLVQAVIYGLGLEGMLSASRQPPFGPALLTVADFPDGRRGRVRESWVSLTVSNHRDQHLRTRRFITSQEVDPFLVRSWFANDYDGLSQVSPADTYVRQRGSAVRDLGFHSGLAKFIGWELPNVPGFKSAEVPLYMEALFPLFYVEQKSGWSGVTPRMPTYLGVRDMLRRSVEYTLGLSRIDALSTIAALKAEEEQIRTSWRTIARRATEAAEATSARLLYLDEAPVVPERQKRVVAEVFQNDRWVPQSIAVEEWRSRLRSLEEANFIPAGERTDEARAELKEAEIWLSSLGAQLRGGRERLNLISNDVDLLAQRLASLAAERERLLDLNRLRRMGSTLGISVVANDSCPTCGQELDGREVGTGVAADLDQSLIENEAERSTLVAVRDAALQRAETTDRERQAIEVQVTEARQRVRHLRDELVGPSSSPSKAQVQEQVRLGTSIDQAERLLEFVDDVNDLLTGFSQRWQDTRQRLRAIEDNATGEGDVRIISRLQQSFGDQLRAYGLRSIPPAEVSIDPQALTPINEGVELAFDLTAAFSASDMIRAKWAYYVAVLEASRFSPTGRHLGLLMFDEPRQQETDRRSLSAFVQRLGTGATAGCQVIYATSEDPSQLREALRGVRCHMLPVSGPHLLMPA
ncbi:hypothetical protein [Streptomyces sp. NPDC059460]|uniref:hypothetical protein n=1 Tax=Streptomyces sp. NPDC059460 TaxID=3346840 RepID=UPI0036C960F5